MGRVAVLHPDLGVGGAERLIVDASKALQDSGHDVTIYTSYHDRSRCFEETRDGTLRVRVIGSWIPRNVFGRFHALLAYLKMIYIAIHLMFTSRHELVLCDQVSACIPFLKLDLRNRARIVFYCHFPDKLLTTRESFLKKLYRKPLDLFEEATTRAADVILVNSKFTASVVKQTFKSLKNRSLSVVYPCVDVRHFTDFEPSFETCRESVRNCKQLADDGKYIFLSLNRFERKKNLGLAIEALNECKSGFEETTNSLLEAHMIVAGGYDERLADCVAYHEELVNLASELGLTTRVTFVKSPNEHEKLSLLWLSKCVIYTPEREHFGIVPLEAMAMSKPVVASATGGPLETIESGENGFLCESDKYSFGDAMLRLYSDRELGACMGRSGLRRAETNFSYQAFRARLNEACFSAEPT